MLTIQTNLNGTTLIVKLKGRLDTITSPELEKKVKDEINDVTVLILDFAELFYISSAGLRVLLSLQNLMNTQNSIVVRSASAEIKDIFSLTGFGDVLKIEG